MSKQLLWNLNGSNKGAFCKWLNDFQGEPRIAWYPSAGEDFRDLLYLHPGFSKQMPAKTADPACPDLFLHSDYFPDQESTFLDSPIIYSDDQTSVSVNTIEELPIAVGTHPCFLTETLSEIVGCYNERCHSGCLKHLLLVVRKPLACLSSLLNNLCLQLHLFMRLEYLYNS